MTTRNITLEKITRAAVEQGDGGKTNTRLYECYTSLVNHLCGFVHAVKLT